MATYRGSAGLATNNASGASITCTLPTGWQPGDFCAIWGGVNSATATFTDPAGWTLLYKGALSAGGLAYFYYCRILKAGDTDPVVPTSVSAAYRWASLAITPAAGNKFQLDAIAASVVQVTTAGTSITPPPCVQSVAGGTGLLLTIGRGSGTVTQTAFTNTPVTNYTNDGVYWGPSGSSYTGHPFAVGMYRLNIAGTGTRTPSAETVASTPANTYFMASTHIMVAEVLATSFLAYKMGGVVTNVPVPITRASETGDGIVVCTCATIATGGVTSVTDSKGNVYVQTASYNAAGSYWVTQWAALGSTTALTTSDTVTVGWTGTPTAPRISVLGCAGINAADKTASANGSSTAVASGATATLSQATELALANVCDANAGGAISWTAPWTGLDTEQTGATQWMNIGQQSTTSTAGVNAQGTIVSASWTSQVVTYSAVAEASDATGAVTLKKMSVAGTGPVTGVVSGAVSLKKMGISGTGAGRSVVTGAVSLKKMGVSGSATGTSAASGGVTLKKGTISGSGSGSALVSGALSLKKMGISGSGTVTVSLAGAVSLKKMKVLASATGTSNASGNLTLKKCILSGSGTGISAGSGNLGLKKMGASGAGTGISVVTGALRLKKMGIAGTGSVAVSASGSVALKKMGVAATGSGTSSMTAAVTLKKMAVSGAGSGISVGAGNVSLKKMGILGTGPGISVFSGDLRLKKMGVAGAGSVLATVSGSIILKKMRILGSGEKLIFVDGFITLKKMGVAGTGTGSSAVSGSVSLKKMGIAGSVTCRSAATGSISLKKMSIFGVQQDQAIFSGNIGLKKMSVLGSSLEVVVGNGSITLKKMTIIGTGSGLAIVTGQVRLKKMSVSGSVRMISVATGSVSLVKMAVQGEDVRAEESDASGNVTLKKMSVRGSGGELVLTGRASQLFIFTPL